MICIPAEIEINEKSIIAQMQRVRDAQHNLEKEMYELERLINSTNVKEKRDSEESTSEFVNEWCKSYTEKMEKAHAETEYHCQG